MVNWKSQKLEHLLLFTMVIAGALFINALIDKYPVRIDLTEENRFSISEATQAQLEQLTDVVYVEVYLDGELPSSFKRLQKSIRETLEQFNFYADGKVQYRFVNPDQAQSTKSQNEFYNYLGQMGIQPTNLSYSEEGGRTEKLIFPGAIISYFGEEVGVMLLKGNRSTGPEDILNQSIENLEYEFISAIQKIAEDEKPKIGIVRGHGELDTLQVAGFTSLLMESNEVFNVDLKTNQRLDEYKVLVLAKPTQPFSEVEKYRLDQYVMRGGKLMMFIDALSVNMDSASGEGTIAFPYETNLTDLLFRYGVRINLNYVKDINCGFFPVVAGNMGDQSQIRMLPWPFFPLINNYGNHQIVRNLDASITKFVSSIDTVKAEGITKTPLMLTSQYSQIASNPPRVSFNDLRGGLNPDFYQKGPQPVSYLLEGMFTSLFKNRILPAGVDRSGFIEEGDPSAIILVADGDFIRNDFDQDRPQDLGYDPLQKVTYANKDFVRNGLNYLLDEDGIINTRLKEIKIRPLDKVRIEEEKLFWQLLNILGPLLVLIAFGIVRAYWRKQKYARH